MESPGTIRFVCSCLFSASTSFSFWRFSVTVLFASLSTGSFLASTLGFISIPWSILISPVSSSMVSCVWSSKVFFASSFALRSLSGIATELPKAMPVECVALPELSTVPDKSCPAANDCSVFFTSIFALSFSISVSWIPFGNSLTISSFPSVERFPLFSFFCSTSITFSSNIFSCINFLCLLSVSARFSANIFCSARSCSSIS